MTKSIHKVNSEVNYEVNSEFWSNFDRNFEHLFLKLRTKFEQTSNTIRTPLFEGYVVKLVQNTNFEQTANKFRAHFEQSSNKLGTNFGQTSNTLRTNPVRHLIEISNASFDLTSELTKPILTFNVLVEHFKNVNFRVVEQVDSQRFQ